MHTCYSSVSSKSSAAFTWQIKNDLRYLAGHRPLVHQIGKSKNDLGNQMESTYASIAQRVECKCTVNVDPWRTVTASLEQPGN